MPYYKNIVKNFRLSTLALIMGAASILSIVPASALAQDNLPSRQFSAESGEIVNETLLLINAGQHEDALKRLLPLSAGVTLNAYERSTVFQMQGASYYELNQYENAIGAFENAVHAGGLLPAEAIQLKLNIAQLRIANGQYSAGATCVALWRDFKRGLNKFKSGFEDFARVALRGYRHRKGKFQGCFF